MQPNAKKLVEHQRKKDRKDAEKALNEKKERIRKAKEAREAAAKEAAENPQVRVMFKEIVGQENVFHLLKASRLAGLGYNNQ